MTPPRLIDEHRHLRGARVLCQGDGTTFSVDVVKHHVE
jgi:hypothetical protein